MLIDTGAAVTLVRLDVWEHMAARKPLPLEPCPSLRLLGIGGESLTVYGSVSVTLQLGSHSFTVDAVVANSLTSRGRSMKLCLIVLN